MNFLIPIIAFIISLITTWFIKEVCIYHGLVEMPQKNRWHKKPVAKFGGIAIYFSFIVSVFLIREINSTIIFLLIGSGIIFLLGLIDDIKTVNPTIKLFTQILLSVLSYYFGFQFFHFAPAYISFPLTILWYVGIINAMNLLDNMDGLSSGIAAIITLVIAISAYLNQNILLMELSLITMCICLGFLVFNFNPAKIFMGDAGSMLIGFLLGSLSLFAVNYRTSNLAITLFLPIMFMAIPIFDTSLVTISRLLNRRKISIGGKDHSSHRLVQLGLSERKAVSFLYIISVFIGFSALAFQLMEIQLWFSGVVLIAISMFFLAVFLTKVKTYPVLSDLPKTEKQQDTQAIRWKTNKNYFSVNLRQSIEMLIDIILITFSYTVAYILRYENSISINHWEIYSITLPVVILSQIFTLSIFRVYRGVWQYIGIPNLLKIFNSILVSFIIIFLYFGLFIHHLDYSSSVLVIYLLLITLLLSASRLFYRLISVFFTGQSDKNNTKNILIYGAGDGGNEVLRSIMNNMSLNYNIIGFIDDDIHKKNLTVLGIPILGGHQELSRIVKEENIDEVIISIQSSTNDEMEKIYTICRKTNVSFKRAKWSLDSVNI